MKNEISKENIIKMLHYFIDKIENSQLDFTKLDKIDYYWDIVEDEVLYNPNISPEKEICLGQITEDWTSLVDLLNGKRDFIGYDFKYISTIIRLLDLIYTETEHK